MIFKLGILYQGLNAYKDYINVDPELTLINFTAKSRLVSIANCAFTRPRCQMSLVSFLSILLNYVFFISGSDYFKAKI